jgi:hypothetical protein
VADNAPTLVGVAAAVVVARTDEVNPAAVPVEPGPVAVAAEAEEGLGVALSLHVFAALATSSP